MNIRSKIFPLTCIVAGFSMLIGMPVLIDMSHSPLAIVSLAVGAGSLIIMGTFMLFDQWS